MVDLRREVTLTPQLQMDSLACWNVRGMNKSSRKIDIKSFLLSNKVYLVGLLETRISFHNRNKVLKAFGSWQMTANYDYSSHGHIWVLWQQSKCAVHVLEQSNQYMHCQVVLYDLNTIFNITFIYAFNNFNERTPLWANVRRLSTTVTLPWLIMGDLNTTLFHDERVRGGMIVPADLEELYSVVEDIEVMDMKFSG